MTALVRLGIFFVADFSHNEGVGDIFGGVVDQGNNLDISNSNTQTLLSGDAGGRDV